VIVAMSNGHHAVGVVPKKSKFKLSEVKVGDKIAIFFSPADMARGTIVNG